MRVSLVVTASTLILFLSGCNGGWHASERIASGGPRDETAMSGEISVMHRQLAKPDPARPDESRGHDQVEGKDHGVTEVGLERTGCFGTCPVYTVIIKSDGTFRYKGIKFVRREGDHTGTVSTYAFDELAQFIKDSAYADLQDSYSRMVTCQSTVYTTAVIGGKRRVVSNYANAGPTKLWAIEELIDKLLLEATWDDDNKHARRQ